jgi:hypothetical protein
MLAAATLMTSSSFSRLTPRFLSLSDSRDRDTKEAVPKPLAKANLASLKGLSVNSALILHECVAHRLNPAPGSHDGICLIQGKESTNHRPGSAATVVKRDKEAARIIKGSLLSLIVTPYATLRVEAPEFLEIIKLSVVIYIARNYHRLSGMEDKVDRRSQKGF